MKKILAIFDGTKYSEGASKYALELAKASNSLLVGVFLNDLSYLSYTYAYGWEQPYIDYGALIEQSREEDKEKIDLNIALFKRACEEKGISYKIHLDKGVPFQEVIAESVFADLLLIDSHTSFLTFGENTPSLFLKDVLTDSQCPVLVVPHHYTPFDKTVLCYDGNPSSIYAIKQFGYLFPELSTMETTVVSINESHSRVLKDGSNLRDLVKQHYLKTNYEILSGNIEDSLFEFLKEKGNNAIVVMGAYGRNALSRLFQQSLSNRIIKELHVPVFITHQ